MQNLRGKFYAKKVPDLSKNVNLLNHPSLGVTDSWPVALAILPDVVRIARGIVIVAVQAPEAAVTVPLGWQGSCGALVRVFGRRSGEGVHGL